jgi:membrane protein implicated in regulation of membrane protease activity
MIGVQTILKWLIAFIIFVGIGYRFFLPFTPYWVDLIFIVLVGILLVYLKKERKESTNPSRGARNRN